MPSLGEVRELVMQLEELAGAVIDGVGRRQGQGQVEQAALRGLEAGLEAVQQLTSMLDSPLRSQDDTEVLVEALADAEQRLAFFQGCTMRRSSLPRYDDEAEEYAQQAEALAAQVRAAPAVDRLVEAYKQLEGLESRIVAVRAAAKSGAGPEPRVLDLPRARVLVARRAVGRALVALDEEEEGGNFT